MLMRTHAGSFERQAFTLSKALEVKNHFQYLVGNNYCGVGNIEAVFICPFHKREEVVNEYRNHKINLNGIVTNENQRREDRYDVMIMARVTHSQMTTQFEVFKDIRTYASERQINYRF